MVAKEINNDSVKYKIKSKKMKTNNLYWLLFKPLFNLLVSLHFKWRYLNFKRKINRLMEDGLTIGKNVTIMPSTSIDGTVCALDIFISIHDNQVNKI